MTSKLNKIKNKILRKKKPKDDSSAAAALETSKKFSSNGSLLSQNGLKGAYSEPEGINAVGGPGESTLQL